MIDSEPGEVTLAAVPWYRQALPSRRPTDYDADGSLYPPRTTSLCALDGHEHCPGWCTPRRDFYVEGELHQGGQIACECPCHPVVVVPEDL